jgi:hypothetical protein
MGMRRGKRKEKKMIELKSQPGKTIKKYAALAASDGYETIC